MHPVVRLTYLLMAAFGLLAMEAACAQPNLRTEITGFWKGRVEFSHGRSKVAVESLSKIERYSGRGFKITKALEYLNGRQKGFKNQTITHLYPSGRSASVEYMSRTSQWPLARANGAFPSRHSPSPKHGSRGRRGTTLTRRRQGIP